MIPYQAFYCPHCGAPGQVNYGQAEYSCNCRFGSYQPIKEKWEQAPCMWPLCPSCGMPIYHGHICTTANVSALQSSVSTTGE